MSAAEPAPVLDAEASVAAIARKVAWTLPAFAFVFVLLPIGRASELPLVIAATCGLVFAWRDRDVLRAEPNARLLLIVFLAFWLPMLLSAVDAIAPKKAWTETVADLRLLPFAALALLATHRDARWLSVLRGVCAAMVALWVLDALVQGATGFSLAGQLDADRVSGVFGDENLKLGPVLAATAPILLVELDARFGRVATLVGGVLVGVAILLAGARAAWISYAIVVFALLWRFVRRPRDFAVGVVALGSIALFVGTVAYGTSERVRARIDRTLAAASGTEAGVDHALAFRLPIFTVGWQMGVDHPVNGVGVRGYRHAYPDYAASGDRFVDEARDVGAYHPHQLLLELFAEMGVIGLLAWTLAAALLVRAYRRASKAAREAAFAPGLALVAMLFPLNTHPAFYSSFWSIVLWFFVAWFIAALASERAMASIASASSDNDASAYRSGDRA